MRKFIMKLRNPARLFMPFFRPLLPPTTSTRFDSTPKNLIKPHDPQDHIETHKLDLSTQPPEKVQPSDSLHVSSDDPNAISSKLEEISQFNVRDSTNSINRSESHQNLITEKDSNSALNFKDNSASKNQNSYNVQDKQYQKNDSIATRKPNHQENSKLQEKQLAPDNYKSGQDSKNKNILSQDNSKKNSKSQGKRQDLDNSKLQQDSKDQKNSNAPQKLKLDKNLKVPNQNQSQPKAITNQNSNAKHQTNSKANQNSNSQQNSKSQENSKAKQNLKISESSKAKQNLIAKENSKTKQLLQTTAPIKASTPITKLPDKANHVNEGAKKLEPLLPLTVKGNQRKNLSAISSNQADLSKFDKFVTIGPPPSQNPALYTRKIAKFILDSRLRFPDAILLTCVGSFYETYFDQAIEVAELLNIKQAKYQFAGHSYPFAGFPISCIERHLKTLVNEHNRIVAIAEQISTDQDLERKIVRIITPGTITDESLIDTDSHNYLLAIHRNELAWLDVSTGSYFRTTVEGDENKLMDQICRIAPKEIIISADSSFSIPDDSKAAMLSILVTKIENSGDFCHTAESLTAEKLIGFYIERNHLPSQTATKPAYVTALRHLELDTEAVNSLELLHTQNGKSAAGSLLSTISRAITAPGKRLLRDRIICPSRVVSEIEARLDMVEKLVKNPITMEDLRDGLELIKDIDYIRLLQRFVLRQGTVNDLISMAKVLRTIKSVGSSLSEVCVSSPLGSSFNLESCISDVIQGCHQTGLITNKVKSEDLSITEVKDFFASVAWNVRPDFTQDLSSLHQELKDAIQAGKILQHQYRTLLESNDLNLQTAPRLGAVVSISKSRMLNDTWKSKSGSLNGQKLVENGSRVLFATQKWTKLHGLIENCKQKVIEAEGRIIQNLYDQVASEHIPLNGLFENLAELDVAQSFATFAVETNCVRPSISHEKSTTVLHGRHPIAARALNSTACGNFIPNSTTMNENNGLIQIITGPNNGGKSTYLRQVAIMHIIAQAGGFVPASQAKLGIVHHIFTRFGSFDNVSTGKGTFLIEMEETCKILKSADKMSLVLMDEVGRGTGLEDGLSIAYGVLKYLIEEINCRTLFSTHLPHLGPLLLKVSPNRKYDDDIKERIQDEDFLRVDKLGFFCFRSIQVENADKNQGDKKGSKEEEGRKAKLSPQPDVQLRFTHRVERGLNRDSSGIDIAKMVGLPKDVIENSLFIRANLQQHLCFGLDLNPSPSPCKKY